MLNRIGNISFGANLSYESQIMGNSIATLFSAKSAQYPDDVVTLSTNDKGLSVTINKSNVGTIPIDVSKKFLSSSEDYIVDKLVKLLRIYNLSQENARIINRSFLLYGQRKNPNRTLPPIHVEPINNYNMVLKQMICKDEILRYLKSIL